MLRPRRRRRGRWGRWGLDMILMSTDGIEKEGGGRPRRPEGKTVDLGC